MKVKVKRLRASLYCSQYFIVKYIYSVLPGRTLFSALDVPNVHSGQIVKCIKDTKKNNFVRINTREKRNCRPTRYLRRSPHRYFGFRALKGVNEVYWTKLTYTILEHTELLLKVKQTIANLRATRCDVPVNDARGKRRQKRHVRIYKQQEDGNSAWKNETGRNRMEEQEEKGKQFLYLKCAIPVFVPS